MVGSKRASSQNSAPELLISVAHVRSFRKRGLTPKLSTRGRIHRRLISCLPARMSRNIAITYDLNPPQGVNVDGIARSRTLSLPVSQAAEGENANKRYYDGLRTAIAQAKDSVGEELTAWRDAVGTLEQAKEPKISMTEEDEEDEEDEEAEREQ